MHFYHIIHLCTQDDIFPVYMQYTFDHKDSVSSTLQTWHWRRNPLLLIAKSLEPDCKISVAWDKRKDGKISYHLYDTSKFGICYSQLFMGIFCHYLLENFLQVLAEFAFYKSCGCCIKWKDQRCSFFPLLKPVKIVLLTWYFYFNCPQ